MNIQGQRIKKLFAQSITFVLFCFAGLELMNDEAVKSKF